MTRDLVTVTGRDLSDDNDELRDIANGEAREVDGFSSDEGYPYTYPFYYSGEKVPRGLSDGEFREIDNFAGRALNDFAGGNLSDFAGRDLSNTSNRDLSDEG